MRMPRELLDDQARWRARPDDQQALAGAAKMADAAVDPGSEQEYQNDEARVERAVSVAEIEKEMMCDCHGVHTWAVTRNVLVVSRRRDARSQRIGPSLSGLCRTTGPSSRRSARMVTGDGSGSTKSGSTGTAPSEA